MTQLRRRSIRSDLIANQESRSSYRRRVPQQSFGIYRPVEMESKEALCQVLRGAQADINDAVYWKDGVKFEAPHDLGITFVSRKEVTRSLGRGAISRGFDINQVMRRITSDPELQEEQLELPLGGLDWFGMAGRKVVARLDFSAEFMQLQRESDALATILEETNTEIRQVNEPDHLTLFRYGAYREFKTRESARKNQLTTRQREEVEDIIQEHLGAAAIESVTLGAIHVGKFYSPEAERTQVASLTA